MTTFKHFSAVFLALTMSALPSLVACGDDDDSDNAPAGSSGASGSSGTSGAAGTSGASGAAGSSGASGVAGAGQGGTGGAAGAGGAGGNGSALFEVNGKTGGAPVPASAKLVVLWSVYSEGPDFLFKYGDGDATGAAFVTEFGADPPAGAINANGLGMGYVYAFKPGYVVPEGKTTLTKDDLSANAIGVTTKHIVVWRDASKDGLSWSGAFPAGYACGRCVPPPTSEDNTSYVKVDCSEVELTFTENIESLDFCE